MARRVDAEGRISGFPVTTNEGQATLSEVIPPAALAAYLNAAMQRTRPAGR